MRLGYYVDINQIHKRYLRDFADSPSLPNSIIVSNEPVIQVKTRSNFLARIDPYVNRYGRDLKIDEILDNTLSELEKLQLWPNKGMHTTLAQKGRANV